MRANAIAAADRAFIAVKREGGGEADAVAAVVDAVLRLLASERELCGPRISIDALKDSIRVDEQARLSIIEGWKTPDEHAEAIADAEVDIIARLRTQVRGLPTAADFGHELIRRADVIALIDESIQ